MSEREIREHLWNCAMKRVLARIDESTASWSLNSPSRLAAEFIRNDLMRMPAPHPATTHGDQQ